MSQTIRILITDDHAVVRQGLRALIATEPGLVVGGEAANGLEAIEQASLLRPDVLIMDLLMPMMDGVEATRQIRARLPQIRVLILTSFADDERVFPAIRAGASGYLLKDTLPNDLLQAVREVMRGRPILHPVVAQKMMNEMAAQTVLASSVSLTEREVVVLKRIARGENNEDIATGLCLSERTVGTHVSNILEKLHLTNRTQAALYALREGLASLYPAEV